MRGLVFLFVSLRDFLVSSFSRSAPFSLELTFLILFSFSINGIMVALAAISYTVSLSVLEAVYLATRGSVIDLINFVDKFRPRNFSETSVKKWFEQLEEEEILIRREPSTAFGAMTNSLRIFVANEHIPHSDFIPAQVVAYPTLLGTWIFIPSSYDKMNGLEKFQFLHELGHLNLTAVSRSKFNSKIGLFVTFALGLFVLHRGEYSSLSISIFLCLLSIEVVGIVLSSSNRENAQIADEMEADSFAFRHARPEWFKDFPAKSVAERFCMRGGFPYSTHSLWISHFVDALDALRNGDCTDDCLNRHYPALNYSASLICTRYLKALLFMSLIFTYSEPTLTDALTLGSVSLILLLLASLLSTTTQSMGQLLLRNYEREPDKAISAKYMKKYVSWYTLNSNKHPALKYPLFDTLRIFCLKRLEDFEDDVALIESSTSNVQGKLFESHDDFDIYCDRYKGINYIFHGPKLNCEIEYLEFNLMSRRITVHTKNMEKLDLGTRIRWLVFPELAREQNVYIVRTQNGLAQEGVEVSLRLTGTEHSESL